MEQRDLSRGVQPVQPQPAFDQETFERVWRRVMPEERPDSPILLPREETAPVMAPAPCGTEIVVAEQVAPAQSAPPATLASAPGPSQARAEAPENDVPCLGASSAVYGAQLQEMIDSELTDWRTYQLMARRAHGGGGRVLSTIAADERRHAKRLSTAYFLISGVRYWPVERIAAAPVGTYMGALRQRFAQEQLGEAAYLAAAEECTDACLRELYQELAGEENTHAWLLRGILEQL